MSKAISCYQSTALKIVKMQSSRPSALSDYDDVRMRWSERAGHYLLLSPFVLATDLILFLRSEIVLDIESLANFLWRLPLDHVRHSLAPNVEESLDVEVVGRLKGGQQCSQCCEV